MNDLVGKTFGELTVLKYVGKTSSGKPKWLCLCSCGNETVKVGANLLRGDTKSCGCRHYEDAPRHDLTGTVFGRLTVCGYLGHGKWSCTCSCGNTCETKTNALTSGRKRSCGCLAREAAKKRATTHGGCDEPLYHVLNAMHQRCSNPNCKDYKWYGAEGKTVCAEWKLENYAEFKRWAMESGYEPGLTIDRIDTDKGYYPDNCRWVSISEQQKNKRSTRRRKG